MSPPGDVKPCVPKTVIVSMACSAKAIAPSAVSHLGISGIAFRPRTVTAPIMVIVAPVRIGPQKLRDVESHSSACRLQLVGMERKPRPEPSLYGSLDYEGRTAEKEDVGERRRQHAAKDADGDREREHAEGCRPCVDTYGVMVLAKPGDNVSG